MAAYRANYASDAGINNQPPIPNVQRGQIGQALNLKRLDALGRPEVAYSWNRNIHEKDMATKKNYVAPENRQATSSAAVLRMSAAQQTTKAYRDAQEFLKAEKDYRAKERFLDGITPGRRKTVSVGTSTSTSGLPVPDQNGVVFSYPASVISQTGMYFQAPVTNNPAPETSSNLNSASSNPVILTRETEVRRSSDGELNVNRATGVVNEPPVIVNEGPGELSMPGTFPGASTWGVDANQIPLPPSPVTSVSSGGSSGYHNEVVMSDRIDTAEEMEDFLRETSVVSSYVPVPAHTPFHSSPARQISAPPPVIQGETYHNPEATLTTATPLQGTKRPRSADDIPLPRNARKKRQIYTEPAVPVPRPTAPPPQIAAAPIPGIVIEGNRVMTRKRPMLRDEEHRIVKRRRIDADVEEVVLRPVREVERVVRARQRRVVNANINLTPAVLQEAQQEIGMAMGNLRPIRHMRGNPLPADYVAGSGRPDVEYVEPQLRSRPRKSQMPIQYENRNSAVYSQSGVDFQKRRRLI
nr:TPA_asm: fiber [Powellomyces chytrid fungus MELD virus 5]